MGLSFFYAFSKGKLAGRSVVTPEAKFFHRPPTLRSESWRHPPARLLAHYLAHRSSKLTIANRAIRLVDRGQLTSHRCNEGSTSALVQLRSSITELFNLLARQCDWQRSRHHEVPLRSQSVCGLASLSAKNESLFATSRRKLSAFRLAASSS
jgi:hypothetical protein